jgi:hypothetical protein
MKAHVRVVEAVVGLDVGASVDDTVGLFVGGMLGTNVGDGDGGFVGSVVGDPVGANESAMSPGNSTARKQSAQTTHLSCCIAACRRPAARGRWPLRKQHASCRGEEQNDKTFEDGG